MPQGEDAVEPDGTDVQAVQQGVPRGDGGPDATPHREVPPRRYLRGAPPRLPVQDMHGAREVGVASGQDPFTKDKVQIYLHIHSSSTFILCSRFEDMDELVEHVNSKHQNASPSATAAGVGGGEGGGQEAEGGGGEKQQGENHVNGVASGVS